MSSPKFYIASWKEGHLGGTDTKIFNDLPSVHAFFMEGFITLAQSDEEAYQEGCVDIMKEVFTEFDGVRVFEYSDMTFSIAYTSQEEFTKRALEKLSEIGHTLYM